MKKQLFIFPVFLFALIFASCRKNPGPITDFYFQCKINGKSYIPALGNNITCEILADTTLLLGGNIGFESVDIGIIKLDKISITETTYTLNNSLQQNGLYDNSPLVNDIYKTDSLRTGQLHIITLDKVNKVVKGTFYFKAYNSYRNDSVSVTDGMFRLHYIIS